MLGRALSDITITRDLTIESGTEFNMDRDQLFGLIEIGAAEFAEKDEEKLSPTDRALLQKLRDSQEEQVGKTPDPEVPQPSPVTTPAPAPAKTPVAVKPIDATATPAS